MADTAVKRLQKEYRNIQKSPVPNLVARPSATNILDWHWILWGTAGSDFEGGVYHGKIVFPKEYPFKPPAISMVTPNGRFSTNMRLCLSMSDYHPETWNPFWSVSTILVGVMSFMYDKQPTAGSITTTAAEKRALARQSIAFNLKNPTFRKVFPDYAAKLEQQQAEEAAKLVAAAPTSGATPGVAERGTGPPAQLADTAKGPFSFLVNVGIFICLLCVMAVPLLEWT